VSRSYRFTLGTTLFALAVGCNQQQHPPPFEAPSGGTDGLGDAGTQLIVPDADTDAADSLCGSEQIPAISDPPNLYFVVDRSGSMGETLAGSAYSKYENARIAISVMLRAVGHRVRYGAAVFPAFVNPDGCAPGMQVFPTVAGDPPNYAAMGENGPILSDLLQRLGSIEATGGTPTAATLSNLEPTILSLTGKKTYVVLMTDGAPNCNDALRCGPSACIPNIEQQSLNGTACDATFNCCDPRVNDGNVGYCVDSAATEAAVADLEKQGVDTYVVGMPGSEPYADELNRLANAGNTARTGTAAYYAVTDTTELSDALKAIGAQVAINCDLPLAEKPDDPGLVNVYFDSRVVPKGDTDGWLWSSDSSIQFHGSACSQLTSGDVLNVQVRSGCPTVVVR